MKLIAIYTTLSNKDDAQRLARLLVERRLVACAQISPIESFYVWAGAVQQETEWRLLLKTLDTRYEAVEAAIRAHHPYELPAIYAEAVVRADADYAAWVEQASTGE